jgi:uncharacterized protein YciI
MKRIFTTLIVMGVLCLGVDAQTQQNQASPASKMIEFQMVLLKRGPKWSPSPDKALQQRHDEHMQLLLDFGKTVIGGPIKDDSDLVAVYIFRTSAEQARASVQADPLVVAEHVVPLMYAWWSEDVMKKTSTPTKTMTAYLAFLTRGEKWTPERTPQTEQLQKDHMANIVRLAELKKLVVAGPFGNDGRLRGIFVFRVATMEEAKALAETDPAVKAGRLALEFHPWQVPEGILP